MSRPKKGYLWCAALSVSVALAVGCATHAQEGQKSAQATGEHEPQKGRLAVYTLDVEQGDSSVILFPSGKTMLIDGGMGGPGYKKKDKGKTVILPLLKEKGIKRIDYLVATHPDFDHIGGLLWFLQNTGKESDYPVEIVEFLDCGFPGTTYLYQDLLKAVMARPEINYRIAKNGEMLDVGEGASAQVVGPHRIFESPNDASIVLKLTCGDISFLLTGDAAKDSELAMIKDYGDKLKSTVLHAGHHGSGHSSTTEFLNVVKPEVIKISVGKNNKHQLPDEPAIERLKKTGAKIYRTDYQGMITITTDGKTYEVVTERPLPPPEKRWDDVPELTEDQRVNINTASAEELRTIPKIGEVQARRIIEHRPYTSVDELTRVPRIGTKILERMRPLVTVGTAEDQAAAARKKAAPAEKKEETAAPEEEREAVVVPEEKKVDINTAPAAALESLPKIGASKAQRIIDARPFTTVDELTRVKGIGPKTLEILRPYVKVAPPEEGSGE